MITYNMEGNGITRISIESVREMIHERGGKIRGEKASSKKTDQDPQLTFPGTDLVLKAASGQREQSDGQAEQTITT
ncbi:MAG TPA: hypothetical protein VD947_01830 [Patescibacteria group bacterium]|nr:hypothetical protein [Patescibacteria group bacterium]